MGASSPAYIFCGIQEPQETFKQGQDLIYNLEPSLWPQTSYPGTKGWWVRAQLQKFSLAATVFWKFRIWQLDCSRPPHSLWFHTPPTPYLCYLPCPEDGADLRTAPMGRWWRPQPELHSLDWAKPGISLSFVRTLFALRAFEMPAKEKEEGLCKEQYQAWRFLDLSKISLIFSWWRKTFTCYDLIFYKLSLLGK